MITYSCSKCNGLVSKYTKICPHCHIRLSGIQCMNCRYIGDESDFLLDRCPKCGSISISSFGTDFHSSYKSEKTTVSILQSLLAILVAVSIMGAGIALLFIIGPLALAITFFGGCITYFCVSDLRSIKKRGWRWW